MSETPTYLSQLLTDALAAGSHYGPARLECRQIGDLRVPSGRVIGCDPMVEPDLPPFALALSPGTWPVGVTIAHLENGDQRIAAAWIRELNVIPVRWEHALIAGMPGHRDAAYGVDSGTGGFVSAEGAAPLAARLDDELTEALAARLDSVYAHTRSWAVLPVPGTEDLNFAAFSSGMGDGAYASFWGYDQNGAVACLLTDFKILGNLRNGVPTGRPWWKFW